MAKPKKDKVRSKALSAGSLTTHEAVSQFATTLSRLPDLDETLRKAGIARHRLEVLLDDDEIAQATETRLDALLATPYRIEPNDTKEAQLLRLELEEWFVEIATSAQNALLYGYSVQEAIYMQKDNRIGIEWIGEKPMEWFEPKSDGRLIYRPDSTGFDQIVDQSFKFFLTRRKATFKKPYGKPLLAVLYWLFFFKQNGFKFWAKQLERFGTPILLGKVKDGDDSDIAAMNSALLSAHAQSVISIDADDDVQILSGDKNGSAGSSFEVFNSILMKQIQKVVLGQTLTSGNDGGGSRALGEVHENVRKDKLKSDIRLITPTVQAVVNALCDLNDWPRHKVIIGDGKSLNKDQATRDVDLKNAGAELSNQYFQREYGLQDGDLKEAPALNQMKFSALPKHSFSFKADMQGLDANQREVDEGITKIDKQLFSETELLEVVESASDVNDLQARLYSLMSGESVEKFTATMARALYLFDVVGYVQRSK